MAGTTRIIPAAYPRLTHMVERQVAAFPNHRDYLAKRFAPADAAEFAFAEEMARKIEAVAGGELDRICEDYRWLTGAVLEEELHFRRSGHYRLSKFEDADREVYSNLELMSRYMNGLLATQLWWRNHTEILHFFRDHFVARNPRGFSHLEIGPGHGLFLYLAASSPNCASAEGWDISDASIATTRAALDAIGLKREVGLRQINLFEAPNEHFRSITFSEVLEHLEQPQQALAILHRLLTGDGRLFVNAPVNSPAPDHLYLFKTPESVVDMVQAAGFAVEDKLFAPCTGASLERARKLQLSISVGVIARKRAGGSG
jgi:2-polyprenyl-3-methyl-5-hydroxy-6-metoxy-1,4-benzoquinol methylase